MLLFPGGACPSFCLHPSILLSWLRCISPSLSPLCTLLSCKVLQSFIWVTAQIFLLCQSSSRPFGWPVSVLGTSPFPQLELISCAFLFPFLWVFFSPLFHSAPWVGLTRCLWSRVSGLCFWSLCSKQAVWLVDCFSGWWRLFLIFIFMWDHRDWVLRMLLTLLILNYSNCLCRQKSGQEVFSWGPIHSREDPATPLTLQPSCCTVVYCINWFPLCCLETSFKKDLHQGRFPKFPLLPLLHHVSQSLDF